MLSDPERKTSLRHLILLVTAAVLFFLFLGRAGLTDPDESAYAESVREMAERGDYLVPHLYGQPLLDKPILFYWAMGASFRLLGESEFVARLPSALAALIGLLAVYRLGWLVHGNRRAGVLSGLILASSPEYVVLARAAVTDMILTTLCTFAILFYMETLSHPERRFYPLAGAACLALSVLTKGPLGLLIPGLSVGIYLVATGSLHRWRDLRPAAGGLLFAWIAVPWYASVTLSRPDLVKGFFVNGNLGRFLRAEHRSESPFYYVVVLLVGFLPWSTFLPGALGRAFLDQRRGDDDSRRLLLPVLWLLSLLVFFTVAASKLPSYILPALPAAAVLVAGALESWFRRAPEGRRPPGTAPMISLVLLAAGMALFAWRSRDLGSIPVSFKAVLLPACIGALLGSLAALGTFFAGRTRLTFFLLAAGGLLLVPALLWAGAPRLEIWKSSREAARLVAPLLRPSDTVLLFRENHPGFPYYLRRTPELARTEPEFVRRLFSGRRFYCLMARDRYENLKVRRPSLPLYLLGSVGHTVVVTNFPPGALT